MAKNAGLLAAIAVFSLVAPGSAYAQLVLSTSAGESLVFNPATVTTVNLNTTSTQIVGRLNGGTPLYDQTFAAAFSSPLVQAGVVNAVAVVTTAGGPGVIIGAPVLTASSNTTTSTSVTTYSLASTQSTTGAGVVTFGPANLVVGALSTCAVGSLPSTTQPTCQNLPGVPIVLSNTETNINVHTETVYTIDQAVATTNTTTLFEQWTILGTTQGIGMAHPALQAGVLDMGNRFLRRLADGRSGAASSPSATDAAPGLPLWFEAYGLTARSAARGGVPGDTRSQFGITGGMGGNLTPNLSLGLGVDHGGTTLALDGGFETANAGLTQIGLYADYASGPWFASLVGTLGTGRANMQNTLLGQTTGSYGIGTAGLLGEAGYRLQLGDLNVTPSLGFDYAVMHGDAFTETGPLALSAPAGTAERGRVWAGLEIGQSLGNIDWSLHGRLIGVVAGAQHVVPVTFAGVPMTVTGASDDAVAAEIGGRFAYKVSPSAELFAAYDGHFSANTSAHAARAGFTVSF